MASGVPNCYANNAYDAIAADQQSQAYAEELVTASELLQRAERDLEEVNMQTQALEKKIDSLNTLSDAALKVTVAVTGVVAFYILDGVMQRYFK